MEAGEGSPCLHTWTVYNASANPAIYRTDKPRTSVSGDGFYRRTNVGLGFLYITAGNQKEYYSSFYMRLSDTFDITSAASGTHQFKITGNAGAHGLVGRAGFGEGEPGRKDSQGRLLESGIYICKITADSGQTVFHSVAIVK